MDDNENIEENIDAVESVGIKAMYYNNIVDRYFTKYYLDEGTNKEQFVFIHTNGVIMCGLGCNNFIVKSFPLLKIKEIKDLNKMTKVSGKRKHGAHFLNENESILQFTLQGEGVNETNMNFNFSPRIKGKLVELNSNIFTNPELVQTSPEKFGYLCFLLLADVKAVEVLRDKLEKKKIK